MKHVFCVAIVLLMCTGSVLAEQEEKLSEENRAIVEAKRQKIKEEITQLKDHPWAGEYYYGSSGNLNLTLAPENGFTMIADHPWGLLHLDHGTVDWDGNHIKLNYTFDVESGYINDEAIKRKPIRWGERVYLIPTFRIIEFCNAINSGRESRSRTSGRFYLRRGDERKEAEGKPELPEEFMPYLLDKPVDATIASVKNIQGNIATIVVDKGKNDGLLSGVELHVVKPDGAGRIILTKVEEKQSEAEYTHHCSLETNSLFSRLFGKPIPAEGWQLSTCPSRSRERGEQEKKD